MSIATVRKPRAAAGIERGGERVARSRWFEWLARAGFVARAVVYVLVGILAVKLALGDGGAPASQQGAFRTIERQPLGHVLLVLVAAGLGGYALWRLVRAAVGHGPEGADRGFDRLAALASGIAYAVLCALAVEILLGGGASGSPQKPAAGVLGWPGGTWLVGVAGAAVIAVGLYQLYRGLSGEFLDDSKTGEMSTAVRRWFTRLGTVGYVARAVVFGLVGVFLLDAAVTYDPSKAVGLDGALQKLAHQPYGPVLLAAVAAGLVAFGVYSLVDARYRRI